MLTPRRSQNETQQVHRRENHRYSQGTPGAGADLTRKYAVSEQSIYRWQARYGGMTVCEAKRSRQLEEENRRLKRMVADLSLDKQML
jgi:putative transposase